ncbi:hypothetical protein [Paenibacillus sp. WLX2291]|uniref:hypothetical protein n=1 Tax=Paenibacillus sp. WLX2291 TaxID=3296934 RepID=UPI003983EC56
MSYDLHITRAQEFYESTKYPITLEELQHYFAGQDDFSYQKEITSGGGPFTISMEGNFFVWKTEEDEIEIPFRYFDGRLIVSGGDEWVVPKMKEIASALNAYVVGDDGERY